MELSTLYRKLEFASFTQREQIAEETARELGPDEVAPLVKGLGHPHEAVRLGVIEILGRARFRAGLRRLLEHARTHTGDDRVFAIRALTQLARPGDEFLAEAVREWVTSGDTFVEAQATALAAIITPPRVRAPEATAVAPGTPAPVAVVAPAAPDALDKLVVKLFAAPTGADRIAAIAAIEARGPHALAAAAKLALKKGNADVVAFICRAVIRQASALHAPEPLLPLLEAARRRLGKAPVANAAIDDAVLALGGLTLSAALIDRIGELEKTQVDAVAARLGERSAAEVALHAPRLLDALARKPALWSSLGPLFVYAAADVRESTRTELRRLAELVVDDLRNGVPLPAVTVASTCWLLAKLCEPGEALSRHLRLALDRLAAPEAACALVALCARLATEEAAVVLLAMLRDPLPEAREAARAAVTAWRSPWVELTGDAIVTRYTDEKGELLVRRGDRLVVALSGEGYILDARGQPVRGGDTEYGGCLCCAPARALVRRRGQGLRCPSSWESHLRDAGHVLFERDHALGRCGTCDSVRPRVRDGDRVVCLDCGAGMGPDGSIPTPPAAQPQVPSEGRVTDDEALPVPPTRDELEHVKPHIRAAITANVFLRARDSESRWNGSGIIIARDGNHIAILTNRHVVEAEDRMRLCALEAMTVSGEGIRLTALWRAQKGVDLAIVEGRVEHPARVNVMSLAGGVGMVGSEVFAIGNPLGLAWSYTAGTLSAIRHWTTPEGQAVRVLQTDANIAPGSSGGGLFHSDGHLLGVMSFLRQGHAGGSAHFALSIDTIRETLLREDVRWRGKSVVERP